ncbi:MAG: DinB family protein [Gillisia sp.]|nr:DinB family protein [Gillisia sp.]
MIKDCITNLMEHQELLLKLSDKQYQHQSELLSGASIGQHLRHVVEFYDCLLNGLSQQKINYEKRARSLELENNRKTAIKKISSIKDQLLSLELNSRLYLEIEDLTIDTSVQRELYYNLEHSIHHQALIKVGLKEQNIGNMVNADFGVAPSTLKYRKQCIE